MGVALGVGAGVGVSVGIALGVGVALAVIVGVGVGDDVSLGVEATSSVGVGVTLGVVVGEISSVGVADGAFVGEGAALTVTVGVGERLITGAVVSPPALGALAPPHAVSRAHAKKSVYERCIIYLSIYCRLSDDTSGRILHTRILYSTAYYAVFSLSARAFWKLRDDGVV